MQSPLVRRSTLALLVTASLFLAACDRDLGASRLKKTHTGMPRDSVMAILGTGPISATGGDSARITQGHHRQIFFINGNNVEVVWYRETPGSVNDSLTKEITTPVVFTGDTLAGWGWKYYADGGAKLGLKDPKLMVPQAPVTAPIIAAPGGNERADTMKRADSTSR